MTGSEAETPGTNPEVGSIQDANAESPITYDPMFDNAHDDTVPAHGAFYDEIAKLKDTDEELFRIYEDFAITSAPEVGTPRVQILQDIADRMLAGTGHTAQIIILNRGEHPQALVSGDGKIFITQSLINRAKSIDQVAAEIAHEIGHIIIKTGLRAGRDQHAKLMHERGSDHLTPQLLAKVGLNSLALSPAIEGIDDTNGRDEIHESGLTRSAGIMAHHVGVDYETSDTPETPLPPEFYSDTVEPTNSELLERAFALNIPIPPEFFARLSPLDLLSVSQRITKMEKSPNRTDIYPYRENFRIALERRMSQVIIIDTPTADLTYDFSLKMISESEPPIHRIDKNVQNFLGGLYFGSRDLSIDDLTELADSGLIYSDKSSFMIDPINGGINSKVQKALYALFRTKRITELETPYNKENDREIKEFYTSRHQEEPELTSPIDRYIVHSIRQISDLNQPITSEQMKAHMDTLSKRSFGYHKHLVTLAYSLRMWHTTHDSDAVTSFLSAHAPRKFQSQPSEIFNLLLRDETLPEKFSIGKYGLPIDTSSHKFLLLFLERYSSEKAKPNIDFAGLISKEFKLKLPTVSEAIKDIVSVDQLLTTLDKIAASQIRNKSIFQKDTFADNQSSTMEGMGTRMPLPEYLGNLSAEEVYSEICTQIDSAEFTIDFMNKNFLMRGDDIPAGEREKYFRLYKVMLKQATARYIGARFESPQIFTDAVNTLFTENKADIESLSLAELLAFYRPLVMSSSTRMEPASTSQFTTSSRLYHGQFPHPSIVHNLQPMELITNRINTAPLDSITDIAKLTETLHTARSGDCDFAGDLFNTRNVVSVIAGERIRTRLTELLSGPIQQEDLVAMNSIIERVYSGTDSQKIKTEILSRIFSETNSHFKLKVDVLKQSLKDFGAEGLLMLADQIHTYDDFLYFKQELFAEVEKTLLDSTAMPEQVRVLAEIDSNGFFTELKYKDIFDTSSNRPEDSARLTAEFAQKWITLFGTNFNPETGTIDIKPGDDFIPVYERQIIRHGRIREYSSISDIFNKLHGIGNRARSIFIAKLLTETNGPLETSGKRAELGAYLTNVLGIQHGSFMQRVIDSAVRHTKASLITLPASRMLGPFLFRAYQEDSIDAERIRALMHNSSIPLTTAQNQLIESEHLGRILTGSSDEVFRSTMEDHGEVGQIYRQVTEQRKLLSRRLAEHFILPEDAKLEKVPEKNGGEVPPAVEAVISAIEASGPLGKRTLQLSSQLQDFDAVVHERVSRSLDSNPGLNKLLVWINLDNYIQRYSQISQFVRNSLVSIGEKIGGGSFYSTFSAVAKDANGNEIPIALKMLTPNAKAIIAETYNAARTAIEKAGESLEFAEEAKKYLLLIDLAHEWAIKDIDDPTFIEDDARYTESLARVDTSDLGVRFATPTVVFDDFRLKAESLASGRTVNKMLKEPTVDPQTKQRYVHALGRLFIHELTDEVDTDPDGNTVFQMRSDPHVGNQVIDGDEIQIIDRHMYLKLTRKDVDMAMHLVRGEMLNGAEKLLEIIWEHNNITDHTTKVQMVSNIVAEYVAKNGTTMNIDPITSIQILSQECLKHNVEIPLKLRLLLKNIESMRKLLNRHGLDLATLR